jgi:hypothetical protein
MRHAYQLAPPVAFFHLAGDQAWFHPPPAHVAPSPTHLEPLTEVGRESREGEIEPVTREKWETARGEELSQGVDKLMCHVLRAGTQLEHGQNFGARINGQPQPEHLFGSAQPGSQFVQLQMRELEVAEKVRV